MPIWLRIVRLPADCEFRSPRMRIWRCPNVLARAKAQAGGPLYYTGRDMTTTHRGMRIDDEDWRRLIVHLRATLDSFKVHEREQGDVLAFVESVRPEIVE